MTAKERYTIWLGSEKTDGVTKRRLSDMTEKEIEENFSGDLEFGTGGLRGIMDVGTNRMNIYTVRKATQGLANEIIQNGADAMNRGVVIAYDSRNNSESFALETANVLCANGIKTYLFESLRPTPELSFAVRYLGCFRGVVVTASHNPKEYNGYKVYGNDGGQIPPTVADCIIGYMNAIDVFQDVKLCDVPDYITIGEEIDREYLNAVYEQSMHQSIPENFGIVYTPLHGSGNLLVRGILDKIGAKNVFVVPEQELPDGDFSTVNSPNPENEECFEIAIKYAKEKGIDLIIGTDPDSDRMGIVVKNNFGEYVPLTGNQVGVLLLHYILSKGNLPENPTVVTTIVSTRMADCICEKFGCKLIRTLTGFKFIGEKIHEFETSGSNTFLFGFEESYGYLKGVYARDKDAVVASMLTVEMAAYYAEKGMTLYEAMQNLYDSFGGYYEELENLSFAGIEGKEKIKNISNAFRNSASEIFSEYKIVKATDYLKDTDLPKSNVLYFVLDNDVYFVVRPSGTEPKLKIYYLSEGLTFEDAKQKAAVIKKCIDGFISKVS